MSTFLIGLCTVEALAMDPGHCIAYVGSNAAMLKCLNSALSGDHNIM